MTEKQKLSDLLDKTVQREIRAAKLKVIKAAMDCLIQQLAEVDTVAAMTIQSTVNNALTPSGD